MFDILVVEDDRDISKVYHDMFVRHGFNAFVAHDGNEALEMLDKRNVDLIVTDVMMPNLDGRTLTEDLRNANYFVPVLVVTAKHTFDDKVQCFEAGADDYMVKPVNLDEMLLRVKALLRRSQMVSKQRIRVGGTEFDCNSLTVSFGEEIVYLPQKEFYLAFKLVSFPNRIFTRIQLMDDIWGADCETDTHTLDVHINRLRERFKTNADFEIVTVRGLGYNAVKKV